MAGVMRWGHAMVTYRRMWPEDDPEKTAVQWRVDFNEYRDTIDEDPRARIAPPKQTADTAKRGAMRVIERLFADSVLPMGNRLELGEIIGTGGVGIVRRARQSALARDVAVKMLKPHKRTRETVVDLLHEAWIAGSLEHPNIVPVHDILMDEQDSPLIVLKRIEGLAWSELIRDARQVRERFGAEDLLEWNLSILGQVLNAVRYAHSRGVVHRDLKPDNVMIGEFGEVYVVDWGLAVSLKDDETGRLPLAKNAVSLAGTPAYMAPEMLGDSDIPISERTDIYLIGSILFEILAGKPPHGGKNAMMVIGSVVKSQPALSDDVPQGLARICRRAMDPDPHGRFENAEQVRLALQGFLQHRGSARLSLQAEVALEELEQQLARPSEADLEHRQELYRLFGACRFGFREAITSWHHNAAARRGLERATMGMIEYELSQGDSRAAAALYAELPEPPAELRQRIEQALATQAADRKRAAALQKLGTELDLGVGKRSRALATLVLGLAFTIIPSIATFQWPQLAFDSHPKIVGWTAIFGLITLAVGYRIRRLLRESAANRRLFFMLLLLIAVEFPLQLGMWGAGFSPDQSLLVHEVVWFFLAAVLAITFDLRLLPAAFGYLTAFAIMALFPDTRLYVFNLPHAVLTINYVVVWRS